MAKITTIIDIGSNSMRMVVFKKTSRFAFHLIHESKSKVKISQGCYANHNNLQDEPMQRAFDTLKSFLQIAKNLKSRKILCVATSALRDAPNKKIFLYKVSKELKLNIKVIDGKKEAYYGGLAALNLLDNKNFTTLDIGGGSTEFAFVENNNIENTVSLNIGTVRIKELFLNDNKFDEAKVYIQKQLETIDKKIDTIVGLGGTARALSRIVMQYSKYPLEDLHGFSYRVSSSIPLFQNIIDAKSTKELKQLGVNKDRYDTIVIGTFIFKTILEFFDIKEFISSSVGVREGVYLADLLRTSNFKFPINFNVSVRGLLDRYVQDSTQSAYLGNNASKIFDILKPLHKMDKKYNTILVIASKLQQIGASLNFDKNQDNTFWYILNGLTYSFSHNDKILVATIAKYIKKSLPKEEDLVEFRNLLPDIDTIQWLSFMLSLNVVLNNEFAKIQYSYKLTDKRLQIISTEDAYLVKRAIDKIKSPDDLVIKYNNTKG